MPPVSEDETWQAYKTTIKPVGTKLRSKKTVPTNLAPKPKRLPPLQGKSFERQLAKGDIKPQKTLDLHGLTQKAAHESLLPFFEAARSAHLKLVLVITGKGKEGKSVLRTNLPRWCSVRPLSRHIESLRQAPIPLGGEGAFLIFLRP